MIICDSIVFLHLHKSGGTFVNEMLLSCVASAQRFGYHLPYRELPDAFRSRPVFGTVRNPWSYYVSWYHFQKAQEKPNLLFSLCSEGGTLGFADTIRRLVLLHTDTASVEKLSDAFPEGFVHYGLNLTKSCIGAILGSGTGFYTFLHDRLYAGAVSPNILKMETLRDRVPEIYPFFNASEAIRLQRFLRATPNLNTSTHRAYQSYYTPELRDLVAALDAPLISAYGYRFEDTDIAAAP